MKLFVWFTLFLCGQSLRPSRLPNGKIKKYVSSEFRPQDIQVIGYAGASIISKNWLENIMAHMIHQEKKMKKDRSIHFGDNNDLHIIVKINELENYIQEHRRPSDFYLAWIPKCVYGSKDVLFIVVCENVDTHCVIKQVIQSPFWSSEQIESNELKLTLEAFANSKLDLDYLYKHDLRYKLAWATWNLNQ